MQDIPADPCLLDRAAKLLPALAWGRHYSLVHNFPKDAMAGLTLSTLVIPQSMAYAVIAALPPVYGLYSAIFPPLVFFFFAQSPFQNIGPYAVVSVMVAQTASSASAWLDSQSTSQLIPGGQNATFSAEPESNYIGIVFLLSFMVGIIQFSVCILGLGPKLAKLMPNSLVAGFMSASGICVLVSQLKSVFGLSIRHFHGAFSLILTLFNIIKSLPDANWYAFALAVLSLACLHAFEAAEVFLQLQIPLLCAKLSGNPQPNASDETRTRKKPVAVGYVILTVIVAAVVTAKWNLHVFHGVKTIGAIPSGLPDPYLPWGIFGNVSSDLAFPLIQHLASGSFSLALVCFVATFSITKTFDPKAAAVAKQVAIAASHPQTKHPAPKCSQDLLALSIATIASSFLGAYVPSGSVSRSALLANETPVTTPVGSLVCTLCVTLVLCFLGRWFENIPFACLATVVIAALWGVLLRIKTGFLLYSVMRDKMARISAAMDVVRKEMAAYESGETAVDFVVCNVEESDDESTALLCSNGDTRDFEKELRILWLRRILAHRDACLWWITFLGVVVLNVGTGILVGMSAAFLFLVVEWAYERARE
ncbi:hypothetical protein HDU98_005929 [Podochytrium sp. JEL0797]|nr:hypothetical protein HDU98_005929 [Podochytrium sp. JEL0797]